MHFVQTKLEKCTYRKQVLQTPVSLVTLTKKDVEGNSNTVSDLASFLLPCFFTPCLSFVSFFPFSYSCFHFPLPIPLLCYCFLLSRFFILFFLPLLLSPSLHLFSFPNSPSSFVSSFLHFPPFYFRFLSFLSLYLTKHHAMKTYWGLEV
jgi:hypothetical protein